MASLIQAYPWQQAVFERLSPLPQALLLSGQEGIGKCDLAFALAYRGSCLSSANSACGECRSCQLNLAETHPDVFILMPEAPGKQIKIDDVRALRSFTEKTPQYGKHKLVVLGPVENLNTNAANALLKTLEEPSDNTRLVLFSHAISQIMATIRSRCQVVNLASPSALESRQWLQQQYPETDITSLLSLLPEAPLLVKTMIEQDSFSLLEETIGSLSPVTDQSIIELSQQLSAIDPMVLLNWWISLAQWLVKKQHLGPPETENTLYRGVNEWHQPNMAQLYAFIDLLLSNKRLYLQGANPNKPLLLEDMLIKWYKVYR